MIDSITYSMRQWSVKQNRAGTQRRLYDTEAVGQWRWLETPTLRCWS